MKRIGIFVALFLTVLLVGACAPELEEGELDMDLEDDVDDTDEVPDEEMDGTDDVEEEPQNEELEESEDDVVVLEFNADGFNFVNDGEYNPAVTVNEGDTVRVEFTNDDNMPHDWVLDEFDVATEVMEDGNMESVEFVADQTGTFEYYCSVGSHREQGMFGEFVVE